MQLQFRTLDADVFNHLEANNLLMAQQQGFAKSFLSVQLGKLPGRSGKGVDRSERLEAYSLDFQKAYNYLKHSPMTRK